LTGAASSDVGPVVVLCDEPRGNEPLLCDCRVRTDEGGPRMAKVNISLDAELVVEVMVLAGVGSPQDAVEVVVRDYIARGHRTEARAELKEQKLREVEVKPQETQG
jgi:Arc/MetJ family transcription regulator